MDCLVTDGVHWLSFLYGVGCSAVALWWFG